MGGILLTHLQNLPCNAHELSEIDIPGGSVKETQQSEIGTFILKFSLIDFSLFKTLKLYFVILSI